MNICSEKVEKHIAFKTFVKIEITANGKTEIYGACSLLLMNAIGEITTRSIQ